nr:jmjC domain-containing protein 8 isoform X3 [Anolis sagrei ordinatus]
MGLPLGLVFFLLFLLPGGSLRKDGGWPTNRRTALTEEESCTIERRDASLTYAEFIQQYAFSRPVILQGITDNSMKIEAFLYSPSCPAFMDNLNEFQAHCTKEELLAKFGDHHIRLSTANTYSYQKVDLLFLEYVDQLLEPQDLDSLGSGSGSGVPFHWHGPGFSEVIFGRKRWFLYPPEKMPKFHPNRTTLSWLLDTYPFLPSWERPMECTIHPGEVLYFPDRWWHATLNLDTSVFISTFLG